MLGSNKWRKVESFYSSLTLAVDGDPAERDAAIRFNITAILPQYELFWKFHVCPATQRRPEQRHKEESCFWVGTADVVSAIAQRSHAVLNDLLIALDHQSLVQ